MIPDAYFRAVIDIWGERREKTSCHITGNCMSPIIKDGDSLIIEHGKKDIHVGDVLVYRAPGKLYAHRLLRIENRGGNEFFILKADRNNTFDQPITRDQILGKVIEVRGSNRHFYFNSIFWKCLNYILAICLFISARRFIADTPLWRGINFIFVLRSKILPRRLSLGLFLWRMICGIYRMRFHIKTICFNQKGGIK